MTLRKLLPVIAMAIMVGCLITIVIHESRLARTNEHPTFNEEWSSTGVVGASPASDLRDKYRSQFEATRRKLKRDRQEAGRWVCEACGKMESEVGPLEAHHVVSVSRIAAEQLPVEMLWGEANLVVLCRNDHHELGHPNGYSTSNPNVRQDAERIRHKLNPRLK